MQLGDVTEIVGVVVANIGEMGENVGVVPSVEPNAGLENECVGVNIGDNGEKMGEKMAAVGVGVFGFSDQRVITLFSPR